MFLFLFIVNKDKNDRSRSLILNNEAEILFFGLVPQYIQENKNAIFYNRIN